MRALATQKLDFARIATTPDWPVWARLCLAFGLTVAATLLRLAIAPQDSGLAYVTYFPAATLAAMLGGLEAGIAATILGALAATTLFIPPHGIVKVDRAAMMSALVFCTDEVVVCAAIEAMRRFHRRSLDAAHAVARAHDAEHEARLAAERACEAKARFLASASHDLRQPYQALRLCHAALESPALTESARRNVLATMDEALGVGESLLSKLLELSVLDAGMVAPRPRPVTAGDVLADLHTRHRAHAQAAGLSLRVRPSRTLLHTDPALLDQVLDHLVANAIRYTRQGGVLVACRARAGKPVFEVWDTGIGIAPEHKDAVFEEFFQVANAERDRKNGLGLGLAVAARTTRLLGGKVEMASRLGMGTRMRVVLG